MNTAVPGTQCGGLFSRLATSVSSGTSLLRVLSNKSRMPRCHVYITVITTPPSASGIQPPSNTLSRLAPRKVRSIATNGPINRAAAPDRPTPAFEDHDESQHGRHHHGAAHRYAISRSKRARGAEQPDEHENSDQKQGVDAGHVDLPEQRRGCVANFQARQEAEMDGLLRQRMGAGGHGLARDHSRGCGEHHHGQLSPIGIEQEEWVLDRLVISQDERTLPQIVDRQRRQNDAEPSGADWASAEM